MGWPERAEQLKAERDKAEAQRDALIEILDRLLALAAQAWAKHDADATEYYIATRDARAAIANSESGRQCIICGRFEYEDEKYCPECGEYLPPRSE